MRDRVRSEWRKAVLVCAKCTKRAKGGFGKHGRRPLARELRALGNGRKGRKADFGVIETRCLKLCPKGRVVVVDASAPDAWLLVTPRNAGRRNCRAARPDRKALNRRRSGLSSRCSRHRH
ncbi:(2Fe-2S) ferredoxin domain-containing protein [Rhizorhabdus dicambivorans]|uniref:(2Fe-2S) ferredoxin domain-containing protein n=1 Tax=Rhizorhabdus dicambivorans TaxID=1850238 RepID=UPI00192CFFE0|nr:(2Fe-2S) ferredoxin domain-containing protein [Rhizorhabdus dicambivorans]